MNPSYSTSEVAALAGIHRDTLLRWLRERTIAEPARDHRGWRVFSPGETASIVAFAKGHDCGTVQRASLDDHAIVAGLHAIPWDFSTAKTKYLTHGLHPYPAKFIPQIPNALIQELSSVGDTIADIFCGSGTTLLEAVQLKRHAIGIDANPLAALISEAKTTPMTPCGFTALAAHRAACAQLLAVASSRTNDLFHTGYPFKSTAWRPAPDLCEFWFLPHVVEELAELRSMIERVPCGAPRTLCSVAFAAIIVNVSNQDSDTRYVRRQKKIEPGDTIRHYVNQLDAAIDAARQMSDLVEDRFACKVINADILDRPDTDRFDLVVTSPPYPNAYSYHLYHRTRLVWLGYDPDRFKKVEIGSHRKYSAKGKGRATPETFRKEFETIFQWLSDRLMVDRHACFVIGDSTIDGVRIDNTSLLAGVAQRAGFREVTRIHRTIAPTRKAFNPRIGKIKTETILVLKRV